MFAGRKREALTILTMKIQYLSTVPLLLARRLLVFAIGSAILCGGCGPKRPKTVRVEGKVKWSKGAWPTAGMIIFVPIEPAPGYPRHPGQSIFGADGKFRATTYTEGDGLMPGKYKVGVVCGEAVVGDKSSKSYVPLKYESPAMSPLELEIKPDDSAHYVEYDVPANDR
jgi:hypothetical protein